MIYTTNTGQDVKVKDMTPDMWAEFGLRWAKWREINWFHAMGDIEQLRLEMGDDKVVWFYYQDENNQS